MALVGGATVNSSDDKDTTGAAEAAAETAAAVARSSRSTMSAQEPVNVGISSSEFRTLKWVWRTSAGCPPWGAESAPYSQRLRMAERRLHTGVSARRYRAVAVSSVPELSLA